MESTLDRINRLKREAQTNQGAINTTPKENQPVEFMPAKTNTNQNQSRVTKELPTGAVIFFARVPHSRFVFSDGQEAFFSFGKLEVSERMFPGNYFCANKDSAQFVNNGKPKWEVYLQELLEIIPPRGNNPNIFIPQVALPEEMPKDMTLSNGVKTRVDQQNAVGEAELAQTEANLKNSGVVTRISQETGPIDSSGKPTGPEQSSLDRDIQAAMFATGAGTGAAASISK